MSADKLYGNPDAPSPTFAWDPVYKPLGYERVTGLSTAKGLTPPANARIAYIVAEDQDIKWRDDGTSPTTTNGMPLEKGVYLPYSGDLSAFEAIELAGGASLHVSYYGELNA